MREEIKNKAWKYKHELFLCLTGTVYFGFLLKYYLVDYNTPDFKLYYDMSSAGKLAQDGFSSLFIWFASFGGACYKQLNVFSLLLMTLALLNTSFFINGMFVNKNIHYAVSLMTLYSCSIFYYFYGKIFYDFPFTAFCYSLCLLITLKLFKAIKIDENIYKIWLLLSALMGFTLSWKPYNIFCIAGLCFLLLIRNESRNFLLTIMCSVKKLAVSLLLFILGYVCGNYNLLINPKETLMGLTAYPANSQFYQFLYTKTEIQWDHVNDLPFNLSVMTVLTMAIFLFVLPILLNKLKYLSISFFMTICLYIYIEGFSPGYAWHGFPFGLFIITFVIFLLSDQEICKKKIRMIPVYFAIAIQIIVCFLFYIPLQDRWYRTTEEAINILEQQEYEIYKDVCTLISKISNSHYMIDQPIKRYKPIAGNLINYTGSSIQNTYFMADNYYFATPLKKANYTDWCLLEQQDNYSDNPAVYQYVIWIVPDCFKTMSDVANIHIYDNMQLVDMIHGKHYSVYLYKK